MKTYVETVKDFAEDRINDYLAGGTKHLYNVDSAIARIYGVDVAIMSIDVNTKAAAMLAVQLGRK